MRNLFRRYSYLIKDIFGHLCPSLAKGHTIEDLILTIYKYAVPPRIGMTYISSRPNGFWCKLLDGVSARGLTYESVPTIESIFMIS